MRKKAILLVMLLFIITISSDIYAVPINMQKPNIDYSGIGVTWSNVENGYMVQVVFKKTPAAGKLHVGDVITEINGATVLGELGYYNLRSFEGKVGVPLTLKVIRGDSIILLDLVTAQNCIIPSAIEEAAVPLGKVTEFQSEQYFYSNLNTSQDVRSGDVFMVFEEDTPIGLARVRQASYHHTELTMTKFYGSIVTRHMGQYRLLFYKYDPISYSFTSAKGKK
jgi:hypothetical protein